MADIEAGKFCSTDPILGVMGVELDFCRELITGVGMALLVEGIVGAVNDFDVFICGLVDRTEPGFGPRFCFFAGGIKDGKLCPKNWR